MNTARHDVTVYGLTTCGHCKRAIEFLKEQGVDFDCVYVDTLEGQPRSDMLTKVRGYNPRISFPTIVVDGGVRVIVGFQPDELREVLEI